ncbi:MAG: hypothetical protein QOF95_2021, partial [Pseudonocardiales bacterium]|nr:hypothetical protein [Pseudonocardiales bacterium]
AAAKKAAPAMKAAPRKTAPARKAVPAKAAAPAKKATLATKATPATKTGPAQKAAPAKKAVAVKKAPPAKKSAPAKTAPPARAAAAKAAATPRKSTPAKAAHVINAAPAKNATPAKKAPPAQKASAPRESEWTRAELAAARKDLVTELTEMKSAYDRSLSDLDDLQKSSTDGAGDDQADAGSKTLEREQEQYNAANRLDLMTQIQRAVERIDAGTYGFCESCGKPIPKARLKAFPSATLDVACKQREERR